MKLLKTVHIFLCALFVWCATPLFGNRLLPGGIAFVSLLVDKTAVKQDTGLPFDVGTGAYVVTTTFDQQGNLLAACQVGTAWQVIAYAPNGMRATGFGVDGTAQVPSFINGSPAAMAVDNAGRILVVGTSQIGSDDVFTTVRYTNTGTIEQIIQATAFTPGNSTALGIEVAADNSFMVTGLRMINGNPVPAVIAYSADGVQISARSYPAFAPGVLYGAKENNGVTYYAGSAFNRALVSTLVVSDDVEAAPMIESEEPPLIIHRVGVRQDIAPPFNAVPLRISRMVGWMNYLLYDDDKIVLAGSYNDILTLIRYDVTAQRDPTFGIDGVVQIPHLEMIAGYALEKDASSNYYFAGESLVEGVSVFTCGSVTQTGDVRFVIQETSLGAGKAFTVVCNTDGTFFVGGQTTINGVLVPTLIKYTLEGEKIMTFGNNGVVLYPQYGRGYISNLVAVDDNTVDASGRMGGNAAVIKLRAKSDWIEKVRYSL